MNIIFLVFLAQAGFALELDLPQAQIAAAKVLREDQDSRRQAAKQKIKEETGQAQKIQENLASLGAQAQRLGRMMGGAESRLSLAAQALASEMGALLNDMTQISGRVAKISQGLREDMELAYAAADLNGLGMQIQRSSQDIADQICLMVVQPLRQRRMKDEASRLASTAPALADAGKRLSEETNRLSDLVHGHRGGPRNPQRHRRNFCDPTDIWP